MEHHQYDGDFGSDAASCACYYCAGEGCEECAAGACEYTDAPAADPRPLRPQQVLWSENGAYESPDADEQLGAGAAAAAEEGGGEQRLLLDLQAKLAAYEAEIAQLRSKVAAQARLLEDMQAVALNDAALAALVTSAVPRLPAPAAASGGAVLLPQDFDVAQLSLGQLKPLGQGSTAYVGYGPAGAKLLLQTPVMPAPFGVSRWGGADAGGEDDGGKYDLQLSFDDAEASEPVRALLAALEAIDARVVREAAVRGWLGGGGAELYTPSVRRGGGGGRFAPTFKAVLPRKDGRFQCAAFCGASKEPADLAALVREGRTRGARMQAIVQLTAVWVVGGRFGLSWKVQQLRVAAEGAAGQASSPRGAAGHAGVRGFAFRTTAQDQ